MGCYAYDAHFEEGWRGAGGRGGRGGWGVSLCSGRPIFIFFIKENKICAKTRHHANNILLAGNLPFDSYLRQ